MTNEQITQWAHQAKLPEMGLNPSNEFVQDMVRRIATLVRNATLEEAAVKCDAWVTDHNKADNCTYNDCDMVAVATDLAIEIRGMKCTHFKVT